MSTGYKQVFDPYEWEICDFKRTVIQTVDALEGHAIWRYNGNIHRIACNEKYMDRELYGHMKFHAVPQSKSALIKRFNSNVV